MAEALAGVTADDTATIRRLKSGFWMTRTSAERYESTIQAGTINRPVHAFEVLMLRSWVAGRGIDLGSGTGRITRAIAPACEHVVALDVSPEMLAVQDRLGIPNVTTRVGSAFDTGFDDDTFDWASAIWLLTHFPQWPEIVREMLRVTKPGGVICFTNTNGDAWEFANGISNNQFGFMKERASAYEDCPSRKRIEKVLSDLGARTILVYPYAVLGANLLLAANVPEEEAARRREAIDRLTRPEGAGPLWALFESAFLGLFPDHMAREYFVVASMAPPPAEDRCRDHRDRFFETALASVELVRPLLACFLEICEMGRVHDPRERLTAADPRFRRLLP